MDDGNSLCWMRMMLLGSGPADDPRIKCLEKMSKLEWMIDANSSSTIVNLDSRRKMELDIWGHHWIAWTTDWFFVMIGRDVVTFDASPTTVQWKGLERSELMKFILNFEASMNVLRGEMLLWMWNLPIDANCCDCERSWWDSYNVEWCTSLKFEECCGEWMLVETQFEC